MINTNPAQRQAFLAACERHVGPAGVVVIQQTAPAWFGTEDQAVVEVEGIRRVIRSSQRDGDHLDMVVEYQVGDRTWTHAFSPHEISEGQLGADLGAAGLRFGRWLTDDHSWFTAHPA
jgi:hypothetical protein